MIFFQIYEFKKAYNKNTQQLWHWLIKSMLISWLLAIFFFQQIINFFIPFKNKRAEFWIKCCFNWENTCYFRSWFLNFIILPVIGKIHAYCLIDCSKSNFLMFNFQNIQFLLLIPKVSIYCRVNINFWVILS